VASADPDGPLSLFDLLVDEPPAVVPSPPAVPSRRTHHGVLDHALRRARAERRAPRGLVVAHAFVSGAVASESERLLTVGGTAEVGVELFSGFDYVALGHLHRPQRVAAGVDTVRYSGTPLPYSFSETHPKQVVLVDMATDGTTAVRTVEVPLGRRVATLTGTLDELLADPTHDGAADAFVRAVVTDRGYVVDARGRLQARFPFVVEILLQPERTEGEGSADRAGPARQRLAPLEAAVGFWRDVTGEEPEEVERSLLESALAHVASAEVQG
jgi:exonuclease SbcD